VRCALWIFFAAGMSRLLSIVFYGFPPPLVMTLLLLEVVGTPILLMWLARASVEKIAAITVASFLRAFLMRYGTAAITLGKRTFPVPAPPVAAT